MSRPELYPHEIDELIIGSRNARHAQLLEDKHEPESVSWFWVIAVLVITCISVIYLGYKLGPIDFNPFSR